MKKYMRAYFEQKRASFNILKIDYNSVFCINIFAVLISFLLIVRDIAGFGFNKYIFLAVCVLFMAVVDLQSLCCMIAFLIPLFNGLPGTYIRLVIAFFIIFKSNGKIKKTILCLIAFYGVLEYIASIWYPYSNIIEITSYLSTLFILFYIISIAEKLDCDKCLGYFVLGTAVFCFVILVRGILSSHGNWLDMLSAVQLRFGEAEEEGIHLSANANALAYYCIAGCFSAFTIFITRPKYRKHRYLYLLLSVFIGCVGFFSLSRSYVILFIAIAFIYFLSRISDLRKLLGTILITALVVFAVYFILLHNSIAGSLLSGLMIRFNRSDFATGNGRTLLFYQYMDVFFSKIRYMLIGTGVTRYKEVAGINQSIHNMFQQLLVCYGFFGCTIFLVTLIRPVWLIIKRNHISFVYFLPLIAVLTFSQTIQFINPFQYMLVYLCGIFAINSTKGSRGELE